MTTPAVDAVRAWMERAVIGHNLCPFAAGARAGTRTLSVPGDEDQVLHRALDECTRLLGEPAQPPATTLLVLEEAGRSWEAFLDLIAAVDLILDHTGLRGRIQLAHFHPEYVFEGEEPVTGWTNRAPHPVLHLLREQDVTLATARHPDPGSIAARNAEHVRSLPDPARSLWGIET